MRTVESFIYPPSVNQKNLCCVQIRLEEKKVSYFLQFLKLMNFWFFNLTCFAIIEKKSCDSSSTYTSMKRLTFFLCIVFPKRANFSKSFHPKSNFKTLLRQKPNNNNTSRNYFCVSFLSILYQKNSIKFK